jgi:hypothetical protein
MSSFLSDHELKQLAELGKSIIVSLECDVNQSGVPCRTDRLEAVEKMKEYLKLHSYKIK